MPRILFATLSFVLVLVCFGLVFWYLMHPEKWNWRSRSELAGIAASAPAPDPVKTGLTSDSVAASGRRADEMLPSTRGAAAGVSEALIPASCNLPATVDVTQRSNTAIFSWKNERGVYIFSSEPPHVPTVKVRTINYWTDPAYFDLDVEYRGAEAITAFRNDLVPDVTGIYKVLGRLVGENSLRKVDLNVVIYPDRATYLQYASSSTGRNMESTGGFYTTRTNEAVTYVQPEREATMDTARHESTHVIVTGILGLVPIWLHEGLAEYFSRIDIIGQVERVTADEAALQRARTRLRSGYSRRLRDFLSLDPDEWNGVDKRAHYDLAGALIFFMMGNEDHRRALSKVLSTTAAQYCRKLDTSALLDEFYPGGIATLERNFSAWLQDTGAKAPHDF
ncbi:MAG TPA: hypothetical protein VGE69_08990 [Pseudomonadales bacterium]